MYIKNIISELKKISGSKYIITEDWRKQPYSKGWRYGKGNAFAVVKPGTLIEIWKILELCVKEDIIIIMQAANTGLTGGSTPYGDDYERPVIVLNTMRIDEIHIINDGKQIIGLTGSTLYNLEKKLKPYKREPHSIIGSTSIGASNEENRIKNTIPAIIIRPVNNFGKNKIKLIKFLKKIFEICNIFFKKSIIIID